MSEAPKVSVLLHLQIVQMQTEQENICKRLLQKVEKLRQVSIEKLFQTWDFPNINSLLNSFSLLTLHSYFIRQVNNATARVQTKKMPSIPNGKSLTFSHDSLLARNYYIAMSKYKHSLHFYSSIIPIIKEDFQNTVVKKNLPYEMYVIIFLSLQDIFRRCTIQASTQ